MEGEGTTDQDYYEFEKLLKEIPSVTSNDPQAGEPGSVDPSPVLETNSIAEQERKSSPSMKLNKLHDSAQAVKNGCNFAFYDDLTFSRYPFDCKLQSTGNMENANCGHEAPTLSVEQVKLNLPDQKSLTMAFGELSLMDGMAIKSSVPDHAFLLDDQDQICLNKSPSQLDVIKTPVSPWSTVKNGVFETPIHPSPTSRSEINLFSPESQACWPFLCSNGVNRYDKTMDVSNDAMFPKTNAHELKRQKSDSLLSDFKEHQQSLQVNPGAIHVNPGMHAFQLLPRVHVHGTELAAFPFQQQYHLGSQFPPFMPPQHLSQSNMPWRSMEEEGYCGKHQQYNQGPGIHQIQNGMHPATLYLDRPVSRHIEQCNWNFYWNNGSVNKGQNHLGFPVMGNGHHQCYPCASDGKGQVYLSSHVQRPRYANGLICYGKDFLERQALDKCGRHFCPEKILTRSHGVNSLRTLKPSSIASKQSPETVDKNGKAHSRCHVDYPCTKSNASSESDGQNSRGSSPDISDGIVAFKSKQVKYSSLNEFVGRIYLMAKDQHGCRFLQSKFSEGTPEDVEKIFVEIIGHIVELMTDPFGNYLIQKLLEVCNEDQRIDILHIVTRKEGELFAISCDMHGTRAVQKLVETLQIKEQFSMIVSSLKPDIVELIKHINGNHVAQRCLQYLPPKYNEFLFDAAVAYCVELATDRQGCCVLQKCIYHSDGEQKDRLISAIISNSVVLSQDQYGNYVVQYILDQKIPWVMAIVLEQLDGNYGHLSMQKYSSNVVEKCLKLAREDMRVRIIQELMGNSKLLDILQDPFGNYVIQSALKECKGPLRTAFVEAIKPHATALRSSPYGKKVLSSPCLKK